MYLLKIFVKEMHIIIIINSILAVVTILTID